MDSKKIFVVEDDNSLREIMVLVLQEQGYRVIDFPDTTHLIDRITRDLPDVLLIDLGIPSSDVQAIIAFIKNNPLLKRIKVVISSGNSNTKEIAQKLLVDYLEKPFEFDQLLAVIQNS